MEKPSKEEITEMYLSAASESLGIEKEKEPVKITPELSKRTKPAEAPRAARIEPKRTPEIAPGEAAQIFTPDEIFWRQSRKEMVKKLAEEIKRISWLDENKIKNPEVVKAIPEIGLDLRAATIRDILRTKYRGIEPETEKADEIMSQLHEMWAEKWLEYLEKERYAEQAGEGKKPVEPEPVRRPRPAEAREVALEQKPKDKRLEKKELTKEQEKLFESLVQKARLEEIEGKFPKNMKDLDENERGRWERRGKALFRTRRSLEYMVGNVPEKEVVNFRDKIMDQFLAEYRRLRKEKEKIIGKSLAEEGNELQRFKKDIREQMKEALSDRFSEESVSLIISYYMKIFDLEYLLGNSK